jgi:hypothetical protein
MGVLRGWSSGAWRVAKDQQQAERTEKKARRKEEEGRRLKAVKERG